MWCTGRTDREYFFILGYDQNSFHPLTPNDIVTSGAVLSENDIIEGSQDELNFNQILTMLFGVFFYEIIGI